MGIDGLDKVVETDADKCVCGHSLEIHSQLSTGCYAIPNLGCGCSGYVRRINVRTDGASEGRDRPTG